MKKSAYICINVNKGINGEINGDMVKGKVSLTVEYQLINVEERKELENHHLTTTRVFIVLGKNITER